MAVASPPKHPGIDALAVPCFPRPLPHLLLPRLITHVSLCSVPGGCCNHSSLLFHPDEATVSRWAAFSLCCCAVFAVLDFLISLPELSGAFASQSCELLQQVLLSSLQDRQNFSIWDSPKCALQISFSCWTSSLLQFLPHPPALLHSVAPGRSCGFRHSLILFIFFIFFFPTIF